MKTICYFMTLITSSLLINFHTNDINVHINSYNHIQKLKE